MRWERCLDRLALHSQSALALLLILPSAFLGPAAGQALVLHEHGDVTDHAHRVARQELSNWQAVHANQHATCSPKPDAPATVSQETAIELTGTAPSGTVILVDAAYALRPSSRSMAAAIARPSLGDSMVYAYCSSNLLDHAPRPPEWNCHSPSECAPSLMTAILLTNHTLLV